MQSVAAVPGAPAVPRPAPRWKTRVLLPLLMVTAVVAVLAYAARDVLLSATDVWVAPVVALPPAEGGAPAAELGQSHSVIAQAPGWIQPWPYAVTVPALTDGVVKEILVLVGDRVEAGQVVARLIDEDAALSLRQAEAELGAKETAVAHARAHLVTMRAHEAEVADEARRTRELAASGGGAAGEIARQELKLQSAGTETAASDAEIAIAESARDAQRVVCDRARLDLARTEVRAPAGGVVMARLVVPGARLSMEARGEMPTAVVRLYDPANLQVRVDVPLADAAKMTQGAAAEVTTEALPDRSFKGTIALIGHEADIQRNTVPVSVRIQDPSPVLRPDMLTRVKFFGGSGAAPTPGASTASGSLRLLVPAAAALSRSADSASVWLVDRSAPTPVARLRTVTLGGPGPDQTVTVTGGLSPGDRIVVDPPSALREGARLRVLGEKP